MTTNVAPTLSWLQKRNESLLSLMNKGNEKFPLFPKDSFIGFVKEFLKLDFFDFSLEIKGLIDSEEALFDMNKGTLIQPLVMGPAEKSDFLCVTTEENIKESMAVIFQDPSLATFFYENDKLLGFHYYFMTEICRAVQSCGWFPSMALRLSNEVQFSLPVVTEKYFVLDVLCNLSSTNFKLRFLVPESTFHSWEAFFAGLNMVFDINRVNKNLPLTCSLEIGRSTLQFNDWQNVKQGTFIVLDSCLFDYETGDGGGFLCFGGKSLFGGKFLKDNSGQFKITNYPTMGLDMEDSDVGQTENTEQTADEQTSASTSSQGALGKVPLDLVVEVARYSTTVEDFMTLAPGSVLDLGAHPSQGVNLIINGRKIGRGELIALGDVLGVRVLELWK